MHSFGQNETVAITAATTLTATATETVTATTTAIPAQNYNNKRTRDDETEAVADSGHRLAFAYISLVANMRLAKTAR